MVFELLWFLCLQGTKIQREPMSVTPVRALVTNNRIFQSPAWKASECIGWLAERGQRVTHRSLCGSKAATSLPSSTPSFVVMSWKLYHGGLPSLVCPSPLQEHRGEGKREEVMASLPSEDLVFLTSLSLTREGRQLIDHRHRPSCHCVVLLN